MLNFNLSIPTIIDFDEEIKKNIVKANDRAILFAAARAVTPVRAAQPVKTGEMTREVGIRYFKQKNGLMAATLSVQGKRSFVSRILENGTKDGRIPPKLIFEKVGTQIEGSVEQDYTNAFLEALEQ